MSEDPRVETLRSMREERDILANKRRLKDLQYLARHGKKKEPATKVTLRESELRCQLKLLEDAINQRNKRLRTKEEEKKKLADWDNFLLKKDELIAKEKELADLETKLLSFKEELVRERASLDILTKKLKREARGKHVNNKDKTDI